MTVTIIDGGMGGEIRRRWPAAASGLWSAQALVDAPQVVVDVHRDYINAGAQLILTNSYSTVPSYLSKGGIEDRYEELTSLAGKLARQAVEESGKSVLVAGAVPPLEESYRPDLVPSASEAAPVYQKLVQALAPWVDLYLCETMSTADEAFHAAAAAVEFGGGKPVYVAWTLDETPGAGLRSGESIEVAFKKLAPLHIDAFLFNCTQPEAIEAGLKTLRQLTDKPLGGYANRLNRIPEGWTLDNDVSNTMREDMDETFFVRSCEALINAGAMMVGGCCGIGPSDIQALTKAMHSDSAA